MSSEPRRPADDTTERHAARVRSGAEDFEALYERLAPSIHAWAAIRLRGNLRTRLEPEDVVQDVWWRAMDSFGSFDPAKGSFRAWIFQIATHTLLNFHRRMRVRRAEMQNRMGLEGMPEHLSDQATSISSRAARSEQVKALLDEAAQLDEVDRLLFIHCALEGRKTPAAARLIGASPAATAKRWQRLRQRLRKRLTPAALPELSE